MDLYLAELEPAAAAAVKMGRLWDSRNTEDAFVEGDSPILLPLGHCELNVVDAIYAHGTMLTPATTTGDAPRAGGGQLRGLPCDPLTTASQASADDTRARRRVARLPWAGSNSSGRSGHAHR